jgi:hypothetical protein
VYQKFGKDMLCKESGKKWVKPSYKISLKFLTGVNPDGVVKALYSYKSLASLDNLSCSVCESKIRVEMHHVRMLKDLKPKASKVDYMMAKANRKQIPLCRECHMKKHRGDI